MKFKTNYPFVMVHGMLGFGKGVILNDYLLPYWGMLSGDLTTYLKGEGFEVYNPGVGPVSSAWDRACELYAQLVGGTVDYGKAHSEKYGHKRFGRTYSKPVFEGWGAQKKVNLVGHSHGAATIRLLATLMYSFKKPVDTIEKMTTYIANFTGGTLAKFWDFQMEQWNLNGFEDGKSTKSPINKDIQKDVIASKDTVYYDVSLMGAKEVNEKIECVDSIYYFSFPCRKTSQKFFTKERQETPMLSMHCCFRPFSKSMGKYKENTFNDIKIDERWLANDGCVPTFSSRAPLKEPSIDVYDAKGKYQKGIWHIYDDTLLDHLQIVGGFLPRTKPVQLRKIYRDHFRLINGLK